MEFLHDIPNPGLQFIVSLEDLIHVHCWSDDTVFIKYFFIFQTSIVGIVGYQTACMSCQIFSYYLLVHICYVILLFSIVLFDILVFCGGSSIIFSLLLVLFHLYVMVVTYLLHSYICHIYYTVHSSGDFLIFLDAPIHQSPPNLPCILIIFSNILLFLA